MTATEFELLGEREEELQELEPTFSQRAATARHCSSTAPARAPLPSDVHGWILSTDRSAIELIDDPTKRRRFLQEIDWKRERFPLKDKTGRLVQGFLAEELFNAMARAVPERRVPFSLKYRPDISHIVVGIPDQPDRRLHPEASDAFLRMRQAAAKDAVPLQVSSAWRSPARQAQLKSSQRNRLAVADKSAHIYGLAVDLILSTPGLRVAEANTHLDEETCRKLRMPSCKEKMANIVAMYRSPIYKWMALYGSRFGWFPYKREPWHWEYNPCGFQERYEGRGGVMREFAFERELDLEEDLEDEPGELALLFDRLPAQYPGRNSLHPQARPRGRRAPITRPRQHAGNWLEPFTSSAIPKYQGADNKFRSTPCSVYVPNAAWRQGVTDLLVFFHGDPFDKEGDAICAQFVPDPRETSKKFGLDSQVDKSGRRIILAVPVIQWIRGRDGNIQGKWSAANLNKFVEEVRNEIGRQSGVKPTLGRLIIAGHSHAFAILNALALEFHRGVRATKEGAMAKLNEVWALDSTYGSDGGSARALDLWARKLRNGRIIAVLNKSGGRLSPIGGWNTYLKTLQLGAGLPPNLRMCKVEEKHCVIPTKYVYQLLSALSYPPGWCAS